jgi:hypothetical protein
MPENHDLPVMILCLSYQSYSNPVMITIVEIQNTQTLMERDAAHRNPSESPKTSDTKAMVEFLEDANSFLSDYTGEDNVPFPTSIMNQSILKLMILTLAMDMPLSRLK